MRQDILHIISIVIPTYNEESNIVQVLRAIRDFNTDNFSPEVILIDNGSTDNTVSLAKQYCDIVKIIPDVNISALRNFGAKTANGKYVGFIDADCEPNRNWAANVINLFDDNPETGVVGNYYSISKEPNWIEKAWFEMRNADEGPVNFLPAGNMAVRRKEFLDLGGFSGDLITGEDYDLCQRYKDAGFTIYNTSSLASIHYGNAKNLYKIIKRERWYGQGMLNSIRSGNISKPFVAANIFAIGIFVMICAFGLLLFKVSYSRLLLGLSGTLVFSQIFVFSLITTIKTRKFVNLFFFIPIWGSYLLGRMLSLYLIYFKKTQKIK